MSHRNLDASNFNDNIPEQGIALLDFWAPWCGPCKMFGPTFEAAASKHADIVFGKINTEEQQELAGHFKIRSIPTLIAIKDGVIVFNQAGALSAGQLEQLIEQLRTVDVAAAQSDSASA